MSLLTPRQQLIDACVSHTYLGSGMLALDGFRKPGFSNQRRLEPQIAVGFLTDAEDFSFPQLSKHLEAARLN
jgi:hypothetical protein